MKKLILSLIVAVAMLFGTAVPAAAKSDTYSFEKLKKYADIAVLWSNRSVSVLNTSVTVKNTFVMKSGDFLVIPDGKTLRLKGGAELNGDIYIENGGSLIFADKLSLVGGAVVSDGTVSVYTDTSLVHVSGGIYISPQGKLRGKSYGEIPSFECPDKINGSVVCLGKTNIRSLAIASNPVAAVVSKTHYAMGNLEECKVVTDSIEALYPDPEKYYCPDEDSVGWGNQEISIFFDNGTCLKAERKYSEKADGSNYYSIFGLNLHTALCALKTVKAE